MTTSTWNKLGAHLEDGGVRFGAFTEAAGCTVELVDEQGQALGAFDMEPQGDGNFQIVLSQARRGTLYWFVIDRKRLPDPYARFLPQGVHGPAQVVASNYAFQHLPPARPLREQVIYELHIGTFTEEGTFEATQRRLPALVELGVTTIELMPVAAFAGEHGWGYDGVALFAPHAAYGTPDQLRALVDTAHRLGLAVLLDVVYNHFGPSGNYLAAYAKSYFSDDFQNAWGKSPNFGEPALRHLVLENARYWLREFAFDGLRLDATHAIIDASPKHILAEVAEVAHELRPTQVLIAEDERNSSDLIQVTGLDALWADDFHHQVRVTLTSEQAGYFAAFEPSVQGVADAINRGWLYTGQRSPVTNQGRGSAADALPAEALVYCIQNHDQIGNRALGERLHSVVGREAFHAVSLLLLFLPMTPLLFMGQEWGASSPFLYFTDHDEELGRAISEGRRREFAEFHADAEPREIPDPQARATFQRSKLRWPERELTQHAETLELYRTALALRRTDPVLAHAGREELLAQASDHVLMVHRWRGNERRVLLVNFGVAEVPMSSVTGRIRLRSSRALLRSADFGSTLPPKSALLLAGEGNLAGLVEARS